MTDWRERLARAQAAGWVEVEGVQQAHFIDPEGRMWTRYDSAYIHRAFLVDCGWYDDETFDHSSYGEPRGFRPAIEAGFVRRSSHSGPGPTSASYDVLGPLREVRKRRNLIDVMRADEAAGVHVEIFAHAPKADPDDEWAGVEDASGVDELLRGGLA